MPYKSPPATPPSGNTTARLPRTSTLTKKGEPPTTSLAEARHSHSPVLGNVPVATIVFVSPLCVIVEVALHVSPAKSRSPKLVVQVTAPAALFTLPGIAKVTFGGVEGQATGVDPHFVAEHTAVVEPEQLQLQGPEPVTSVGTPEAHRASAE